jgi:hypothetical protein
VLIILNAMSSIGVKYIALEFLKVFNSQTIDDYHVNFSTLQIKDKNENILYDSNQNIDELVRIDNSLFQKIIKIDNNLRDLSHTEHYSYGYFEDFYYDYGITNELIVDLWQNAPDFVHGGVSYQKTLNNYLNRQNEIKNYVISGQFSKSIIERFKNDLGKENVIVVNIIRNLSSSLALHIQDEDYFLKYNTTEEGYYLRIFESTLSAIAVMSIDDVYNIRFEDFLENKFIEIKDKRINLPELYNNFNNLLTYWEKEKLVKTKKCTSENLNYYNDIFSNSTKAIEIFLETQKLKLKYDLIGILEEKIKNKESIPPLVISLFNGRYVLSDGMHRYYAYKKVGIKEILVTDGTKTFNMDITELDKIVENGDEYEYNDHEKERFVKALPSNFFEALGYQPLTLSKLYRNIR